jgi:hypothetical protein
MTHPLYVLLPADTDWPAVAGTSAQSPAEIRWYLRQHMPDATRSVAVLVPDIPTSRARRLAAVLAQADRLGAVVVDAETQLPLDRERLHLRA